jgi:myo-inositol-1(or 4)-monophosphatase
MANTAGIRRFGAASLDLAYVAAGRCDGFWEMGLKSWDIAAGIIMVREAGGYVSDLDGSNNMLESGNLVAANTALLEPLTVMLQKAG